MLKKNKYKPSNQTLKLYKECVINILIDKYKFSERETKHWYREFGFDEILVTCNYVALNDDPEYVADNIYEFYLNNNTDVVEIKINKQLFDKEGNLIDIKTCNPEVINRI